MTVGLMAAMQGHDLLPGVTMTGTINPLVHRSFCKSPMV